MIKKLLKFKDQKEVERWHKKRVEAVKRIAQHKDFHVLVEYWEIEYNTIDNKLDKLKGRELEEAVIERNLVKRHLTWISSLTE